MLLLRLKWVRRSLALWLSIATAFLSFGFRVYAHDPAPNQRLSSSTADGEIAIVRARTMVQDGHIPEAAEELSKAAEKARLAANGPEELKLILALSGCRIRLFDYRRAQQAATYVHTVALRTQDSTTAGAAAVNLATIYSQLGDYPLAAREASEAADLLKDSSRKDRLAAALLIYANVQAERARSQDETGAGAARTDTDRRVLDEVEHNYRRGIEVAHTASLPKLESRFWEELGYSLLLAHRPQQAEQPLQKAFLLESSTHDEDWLAINQAHQAELQLQKGNDRAALGLIDQALSARSATFRSRPLFYTLHIRGVILENLHRESEALVELRKAVDAATEWRQGALPGDAASTRTVVVLHDVYKDYAQLAAQISLKSNDPTLAREALIALAENRAANLCDEIKLALFQKQRLPQHYFDLLSKLQSAQARVTLGENRPQDKAELEQVRLEIGDVENDFGLKPRHLEQINERNPHRNSLRDIQARLSDNEVLLSFCLGEERSFLWAVTKDRVTVHKLASEAELGAMAKQFSQAVQRRQDTTVPGRHLSQALFAGLPREVWSKSEWLVVGDGVLLDGIPFSGLPDISDTRSKTLTQGHNLRYLPSELLLLSSEKTKPQHRFVGVADPIYNIADARWKNTESAVPDANRASMALPRLAGSDREVRGAGKDSGMNKVDILLGEQATIANLQRSIAKRPELLHFAVHVVSPQTKGSGKASQSSKAALALSLTRDNMPELLTPEAIATLRVPGSLVILSGCSSQKGEILPSAGLMGLSRAWLLAGADAVVVSAWPTPDDSGLFFSSFYRHFDANPAGSLARRAAAALQQAQLEMEHGSGYRSAPKFWAAYSVISKE